MKINSEPGDTVIYAWKPDTSEPVKCCYLGQDTNGRHELATLENGAIIKASERQIYNA